MIRLMLIGFFSTMIIGILSYQVAYSSFHSSATSQNNTFSTSSDFGNQEVPGGTPSATPTPTSTGTPTPTPGHIVINEVSPLGGNNIEWVELFNPTANPISVNGWIIKDDTVQTDTLPNVSIPAGGYAVLVSSDTLINTATLSALIIPLDTTGVGNGLNNTGGDSVELRNGAVTVDAMNYGDVHTFFTGTLSIPTVGKTLSRKPNGIDTDLVGDWVTSTTSTIGVSN